MQTFLPYADFQQSFKALDRSRLGKQRVEAFQLLVANGDSWALEERQRRIEAGIIKDKPVAKGWINHPAAVMWRDYPDALRQYMNDCINEWTSRGYNSTMAIAPTPAIFESPYWLGDTKVHSSHRSNLLFKGKVDSLADVIKTKSGERSPKIWLKANGFKDVINRENFKEIYLMFDSPKLSNYYDQFGWQENDNLEYVWPTQLFQEQA